MWGQLHRICKKFVTLHRKFDEMTRREINIVKREQKMAETFGRYNIIATLSLSLSLSLSLRRSPIRETVTPFILRAGRPRQYTAFLGTNQGKPACFLSLSDCNGGDGDRHKNNKHYLFTN